MSVDSQGTKARRNIAENFNWMSREHERHRQTTDGRATAYSECGREFTFRLKTRAKMFFQTNRTQAAPLTMHCNALHAADGTIPLLPGGDGSAQRVFVQGDLDL